jgi:hypothetical protein
MKISSKKNGFKRQQRKLQTGTSFSLTWIQNIVPDQLADYH